MRFPRTQLKLLSILFYLIGLAAIFVQVAFHPMSIHLLPGPLISAAVIGGLSFAFDYFHQSRHAKDRTLDYSGWYFVFFVLCRPIVPLAVTMWAILAIWKGSGENLDDAMIGLAIFLAYHVADFLRMKQNGFEAAES